MINQPHIPKPEISQRLLAGLRRSRLAMESATLELEDITMQLENYIRQQRLVQLKQTINNIENEKVLGN